VFVSLLLNYFFILNKKYVWSGNLFVGFGFTKNDTLNKISAFVV